MKPLCRTLGALLLVAGQAAFATAEEVSDAVPHAPYELTRSLHALQDQIALGSEAALAAQRALLIHVGEQFLAVEPQAWREPVNARAAIAYVLSGGQPQVLRALLENEALPPTEADLARAALAYATGRRAEALSRFQQVNARTLAPSLGAHVALVQATLTMDADPERAAGYLETARLLAPGTLVEESALRRHLSVASALSDVDSFVFLARQYIRRFPRSIYAANFLHAFPDLWTGLGLASDADAFARLEETLAGLETAARRGVYLSLARHTVLAGDRELARFAAERAAELSGTDGVAAVRARLYAAAARVAGPDPAFAWRTLRAIDPALLSETDAELHAAALALADQVQQAPVQAGGSPESVTDDRDQSPVLARAHEAIAAADALLRRTR